MKTPISPCVPAVLALAYCFLSVSQGSAQQTVEIINDNSAQWTDDQVYVLFVGNPAAVTSNGSVIGGVRDLSLPVGTVSANQTANSTTINSTSFAGKTLPATPFPLQFLSGNHSTTAVHDVIAYDSANGTFTLNATTPVANPQATSDQFVVGAYSEKLSNLALTGNHTSTLSGLTQNKYTATVGNASGGFASGVVYISYGQPLTYLTAAPAISTAAVPFQTIELTTAPSGGTTTSDLTVIDYFAIPLQIESVNTGNGTVTDRRTFYFSGNSIESDLMQIGARKNIGNALYLGPGQVAANNGGNPSPFPNFSDYLSTLVAANQTITIEGTQAFGTPNPPVVYGITVGGGYTQHYSYNATISGSGGNFTYTLTPFGNNTITNSPAYFPPPEDVANITLPLPAAALNDTIYGCVLNSSSFQVNLKPGAPSLAPATLSGPFSVTTVPTGSATTNATVQSVALAPLQCTGFGGLSLQFTSGSNNATISPILTGSANGTVTLTGAALPAAPQPGDQFQILFQVTSAQANNTGSSFQATQLGSANLNFLSGNITFVQCNSLSANNTAQTVGIATVDSSGNVRTQVALPAAPVAGDLFSIQVAPADIVTQLYTNSGYSWVAADILAGLNFGYPGSVEDGDSTKNWFSQFPQEFPYGLARPAPDDGLYNPWAAYFYNASDAYAFAFSDRVNPSPLMGTTPATQAFRITVLPANQIDAPLVTATSTNSTISLSWQPAGGNYSVTTDPAIPPGQISVIPANGTATLSSLPPGTPYSISVQGTSGNQTSLVLPVLASTTGAVIPATGDAPFKIGFTWAGGATVPLDTSRYAVQINGQTLAFTGTAAAQINVTGGNGTNVYVIDFIDTQNGNRTVYQSALQLDLALTYSGGNATSFTAPDTPRILGSTGSVTLAGTTPYTITYNAHPNPPSSPLVVNISFNPAQTKQFAPVHPTGPEISATGNLTAFTTTNGTASAAQSFTAGGVGLDGNITVTAPSSFEVSSDGTAYSPALDLVSSNGTVVTTTLYARIAASAPVGSPSGTISFTSANATTQTLAVTGSVTSGSQTPYATWLTSYPSLTGNATLGTADPDGDGFNNDMEFAFDGDPTVPTSSLLTATSAAGNMTVTFVARKSGTTYQVQSTTNLVSGFTNNPVLVTVSTDQPGVLLPDQYERRQFTAPITGSKIFFRVVAEAVP